MLSPGPVVPCRPFQTIYTTKCFLNKICSFFSCRIYVYIYTFWTKIIIISTNNEWNERRPSIIKHRATGPTEKTCHPAVWWRSLPVCSATNVNKRVIRWGLVRVLCMRPALWILIEYTWDMAVLPSHTNFDEM